MAIFSRAGGEPFFLPLQFRVPLPNWMAVDTTPNIYHLVELKDTYHRYVVMISTEESVRIYEVNLGAVTEQLWKQRPELRKRVGREWTKEHYQNHRRDRAQRFIKEKIKILEQVMSAGGYTHLVLAGHPTITSRVRSELPKHLAEQLIDVVPASGRTPVSDVVKATLASFIEQEEKESRATAEEIERQIRTGGLAVIGTEASLQALRRGQADMLVMARSYSPEPGWKCTACGFMGSQPERPKACPECEAAELQDLDVRETMVKLAEQQGCTVEVVNQSEPLTRFGGVGCLLRYRLPDGTVPAVISGTHALDPEDAGCSPARGRYDSYRYRWAVWRPLGTRNSPASNSDDLADALVVAAVSVSDASAANIAWWQARR